MDNLENKMKQTNVAGVIPGLFEGKMIVSCPLTFNAHL